MILVGFIVGVIVFGVGIYLTLTNTNAFDAPPNMNNGDSTTDKTNTTQETSSRLFLMAFVIILGFGMLGFFLHIKQRNNFQELTYNANLFFRRHNSFFKITKYQIKQLIIAKALIKEIQEGGEQNDVK